MKGLVLLLAVVLLGADADCDGHEDGPVMRLLLPDRFNADGMDSPGYWQDPRTGLCFASANGEWPHAILVPCGVVEGARSKIVREQEAR